jgi:hypothetical protein
VTATSLGDFSLTIVLYGRSPIRRLGVQGRVAPIAAEALAETNCLRSAMAGTLQHAQISAPRTDCVTILVGHQAG